MIAVEQVFVQRFGEENGIEQAQSAVGLLFNDIFRPRKDIVYSFSIGTGIKSKQ